MAYVLKLNPTQNLSQSIPVTAFTESSLIMDFHGDQSDITYTVQSSMDLQIWTITGVSLSDPDLYGMRTASVVRSSSRLFLRLAISN